MAGKNQTFTFAVPKDAKAGPALFAWYGCSSGLVCGADGLSRTWIAVTGQRDEYYMNCAAVSIAGRGTSTLDAYPDMFVGDMDLPGQIGAGECRSTAGTALVFPNPGPSSRVTETRDPNIPFKKPTAGRCVAPGKVRSRPAVGQPDMGAVMKPVENVVYVEEYDCGG